MNTTLAIKVASTVLMLAWPLTALGQQLATVDVHEPGELRPLSVGVDSYHNANGSRQIWAEIPESLLQLKLDFYYVGVDSNKLSSVEYGKVDFTVTGAGPLWMLTTSRYGQGGNSSGDWMPELTSQAMLIAQGWRLIRSDIRTEGGYGAPGSNPINDFTHDLWERFSLPGESFSIRTEKYVPPTILQGNIDRTPSVSISPGNTHRNVGESQTFTATSESGIPPFTYQWRRNGVPIARATGQTLQLSNLQRNHEGLYDVIVKNAFGVALSRPSRLSLPPLVNIISGPSDVTVNPGERATFTISAPGATLQWLKNGKVITGETGQSFTISTARYEDSGTYSVVATTSAGKTVSAGAQLRVKDTGLLVYKFVGSGRTFQRNTRAPATTTGFVVLDRENQKGGMIICSLSGRQKIHRIEVREDLDSQTTGPVSNSLTVVHELKEGESGFWLSGTDNLLLLSKTERAFGPSTLSGFANDLGSIDPKRVEELKLRLDIDSRNSTIARTRSETVESTLGRISQELKTAGSALMDD